MLTGWAAKAARRPAKAVLQPMEQAFKPSPALVSSAVADHVLDIPILWAT
jgi:hypothetical protein